MKKSTHSDEYQAVLKMLVELREKAGMTQRDLAKKVKREQTFVWRIECGERRLDVVEFFWVCKALGVDAKKMYGRLADAFNQAAPVPAPKGKAKKPAKRKG